MNINYKIDKLNYGVTFCENKEAPDIINNLKKHFFDKKVLVIMDRKLSKNFSSYLLKDLSLMNLDLSIIKLDATKKNKNEKVLFQIIDTLIKKQFTKKSVIISCGGGVIGDLCALASSLYLRGLIYYHIPTTMTAIVDSCIGGKTGINYKEIINSVGTYYHPKRVFISKNVINLIPQREFLSGIPEIIKSGLINDNKILKLLNNNKKKCLSRNYKYLFNLISRTLKTKIKFFKNDIYENSKRLNLNFGHTFAHAIEMTIKSKKEDIIRHGEAVGIGMLCEIFYFEGKSKNFIFVENLLQKYNLPTNLKKFTSHKNKKRFLRQIYKNIFLDKKRIGKHPRCIKIIKIGKSKVIEMKDTKRIKNTINSVLF
jgi:3-dehydroquinate synthetase